MIDTTIRQIGQHHYEVMFDGQAQCQPSRLRHTPK